MKAEFTIADSISLDTVKTYVDYLKRYFVTEKNRMTVDLKERKYSFKGVQSKESYLKMFMTIVERMISNFDEKKEDPKNTENPHVGRRKKK
jgi:hypothetical protein